MEKFAVIGSSSFSGVSFVDYVLRENPEASVVGISRSPEKIDAFLPYRAIPNTSLEVYQLDVNKHLDQIVEVLYDFRPDYIVNYAAQGMVGQSWDDPEQWMQTNGMAILNIVDRFKDASYLRRYIQISTPEVYGSCIGNIKEEHPLNPSTPYASSKASGDHSIIPFIKQYNFPAVFTRASNVYGIGQQLYRIIPRTVLYIKSGKSIPLHGGGKAIKSYIHIKDVSDATLKIARGGTTGEVYHISPDGAGISIYDLVQMICEEMDVKMEDVVEIVDERPGQDAAYIIDSTKVREQLNWQPIIPLRDGIKDVIEWVNQHYDALMQTPLDYIHKI